MNTSSSHIRLDALDGLRGFAILLVFLNHIPTGFILQVIPQWLFGWVFLNGVTGVTFLFILSGFLMYYIYPYPPSGRAFLQKRYTRIFPLFLTMSLVMFTGRQLPSASWVVLLAVLFSYPVVTHFIWTKVIKKLPAIFGTILFSLFFCIQVASALIYIFWINKLSFAAFAANNFFHEAVVYFVNATLTLPFGQYVSMLDGVYWSLASEVLFYILYPIVVIPLIQFLLPQSRKVKIAFLVSLFFLLGGVHILSYKIFVLSLVQPALFFYFATGIILAYLFKQKHGVIEQLGSFFTGKLFFLPLLIGFITIMTIHDLSFLGQWISPWVRMIFAIPITFCVALLLSKKTILYKVFSTRWLVFLGMVSYSIYLSHALVIHIGELLYTPTNLLTEIGFIAITLLCECVIAYYLYRMLEKPYFATRKTNALPIEVKKISIHPYLIFSTICLVYLFGILAAYQSKEKYNFFSLVVPISQSQSSTSKAQVRLDKNNPVTLEVKASANNLGLVSVQMHHMQITNNSNPQTILFTFTQKGSATPLATAMYRMDQFNSGDSFPFGFPLVANAMGKTYLARFVVASSKPSDYVVINTNSVKTIYNANKKQLLTNPLSLVSFLWSKLHVVITTAEALFVTALLLPFVAFFVCVWVIGKRANFRYN